MNERPLSKNSSPLCLDRPFFPREKICSKDRSRIYPECKKRTQFPCIETPIGESKKPVGKTEIKAAWESRPLKRKKGGLCLDIKTKRLYQKGPVGLFRNINLSLLPSHHS